MAKKNNLKSIRLSDQVMDYAPVKMNLMMYWKRKNLRNRGLPF